MLGTIHKAIHVVLQPPKEVGLSCHVLCFSTKNLINLILGHIKLGTHKMLHGCVKNGTLPRV